MRPVPQRAVLLFGLSGLCLTAAFALELGRLTGWSGAGPAVDASDVTVGDASDVTGSIEPRLASGLASRLGSRQRLPLTDEQRGRVFDDIIKLADAPVAKVPAPDEATAIPSSVALQELPEKATRDVPEVAGYKFVKLDDWILLVSPADRSVVAEMPRYRTVLQ